MFTQTVVGDPRARHRRGHAALRHASRAISGGTWELALPLVVAPRYVPGTASGRPTTGTGRAPDTDRAPDASRVTPGGAPGAGGTTDVALEFARAGRRRRRARPTSSRRAKRGYIASSIRRAITTRSFAGARRRRRRGWVEAGDGGGYAAVVVEAPPRRAAQRRRCACVLVLDRAATTRGDADAVERPLVRALLGALDRDDASR